MTIGLREHASGASICALLCVAVIAAAQVPNRSALIDEAGDRYGAGARARVETWLNMMVVTQQLSIESKLRTVNDFANDHVRFVQDPDHWKMEDYWATPMETFGTGAGDCEDFAIAKYVSLRQLGVPDEQLRITYVRAAGWDLPHMVLTWYATPGSEPLVLDNLDGAVRPASARRDLTPVYSFNAAGLWVARDRRGGNMVGSSDRIGLWTDMLARMRQEGLDLGPNDHVKGGEP